MKYKSKSLESWKISLSIEDVFICGKISSSNKHLAFGTPFSWSLEEYLNKIYVKYTERPVLSFSDVKLLIWLTKDNYSVCYELKNKFPNFYKWIDIPQSFIDKLVYFWETSQLTEQKLNVLS